MVKVPCYFFVQKREKSEIGIGYCTYNKMRSSITDSLLFSGRIEHSCSFLLESEVKNIVEFSLVFVREERVRVIFR